MSEDLIPLQTAYIRQSKDVENNTWIVFNTEDEELAKLPNTLDPKQAMSYMHFARPFELAALNIGIRHGIKTEHIKAEAVFQAMRQQMKALEERNILLSNKLEKFIIEQEEI